MKQATQQEQEKSVIDITPKENYIIVYESVYKNTELNAIEIALLVKILSLSPTFKHNLATLSKILHIPYKAILKASKGLQQKGYLSIKNNGIKGITFIVNQKPIQSIDINNIDIKHISVPTMEYLLESKQTPKELKKAILEYLNKIINTKWVE